MSNINDYGFPFTSVSGDRQYGSAEWREYFENLVTSGVVGDIGNELVVSAQSTPNKSVYVDTGSIVIKGAMLSHTNTSNLTIAENTSGNPRIDRIVARLNYTDRKIEFAVKQGTPAASPSAPALTQNTTYWELSLAQIAVANSFSTITAGNITDERNDETACGYFKYRAKPAWYPGGDVPYDAWMYTNFKAELTAGEISDIEANSSLMEIINDHFINLRDSVKPTLLQTYATPGTYSYTVPAGVYAVRAVVVGGGGGGAGGDTGNYLGDGGAGGGGAYVYTTPRIAVTPEQSIPVVVGAGGTAGAAPAGDGGAGGTSSFNGMVALGATGGGASYSSVGVGSSKGGAGGRNSSAAVAGQAAGTNLPKEAVNEITGALYGAGGGGGGAGDQTANKTGAAGGVSSLGNGGTGGNGGTTGQPTDGTAGAAGCGGGGGGSGYNTPGKAGGKGGDGFVLIYRVI